MTAPMTTPKDGGPAFPSEGEGHNDPRYHSPGMSLRDWFAGVALQGMIARIGHSLPDSYLAKDAYRQADAMLAEREKRNG